MKRKTLVALLFAAFGEFSRSEDDFETGFQRASRCLSVRWGNRYKLQVRDCHGKHMAPGQSLAMAGAIKGLYSIGRKDEAKKLLRLSREDFTNRNDAADYLLHLVGKFQRD